MLAKRIERAVNGESAPDIAMVMAALLQQRAGHGGT